MARSTPIRLIRLLMLAGYLGVASAGFLIWRAGLFDGRRAESLLSVVQRASATSEPPLLVFIFQPEDCARSLGIIEAWNAVHRSKRLTVIGLMLLDDDGEVETAQAGQPVELDFPILALRMREVALPIKRLGYDATPLAVLLDGSGRVRLTLRGDEDMRDRQLVRSLLATAWGT